MILAVAVAFVLQAQDATTNSATSTIGANSSHVAKVEPTHTQSGEELVCRTRRTPNSRFGRRVCMTRAAADELADRAREEMRQMLENSGHNNQ